MAETNEPKKETVRIKLPPPQLSGAANSTSGKRETVRINLPPRAPSNNIAGASQTLRPPTATDAQALPGLGQPPRPPSFPVPSIAEPIPSAVHSPSLLEPIENPVAHSLGAESSAVPAISAPSSPGPKKETARIAMMPERKSVTPTVKMSKTQPLITAPEPTRQTAPIFIEPENPTHLVETLPGPMCWGLLGISALVFIIQLWTYLS